MPEEQATTDEITRRLTLLEDFLADLREFWHGEGDPTGALKTRVNRAAFAVREVVIEAGCLQLFTLAPPAAIGGLVHRGVDPFTSLFRDYFGRSLIPNVIDMIDQTIGVVQSPGYLEKVATSQNDEETVVVARGLQRVEQLCRRFPQIARQLQDRHNRRGTIEIDDEYDVQDLFHALLRLDFDDIRDEEWSPSYAGKNARVDFLLKPEKIIVEIKKTRKGLGVRELGDQLIVDIARYQAHPDCRSLVCFVYDPDRKIGNPRGLETDLSRTASNLDVRVVVAPSD